MTAPLWKRVATFFCSCTSNEQHRADNFSIAAFVAFLNAAMCLDCLIVSLAAKNKSGLDSVCFSHGLNPS